MNDTLFQKDLLNNETCELFSGCKTITSFADLVATYFEKENITKLFRVEGNIFKFLKEFPNKYWFDAGVLVGKEFKFIDVMKSFDI